MGIPRLFGSTRQVSTWPMFRHVERQAHLFGEMMERVGADVGAAAREGQGSAFATASRRCLLCRHSQACRQWLDAGGGLAPPDFCPNAAFLTRARDLSPCVPRP
jgi:hypothetical protein